MILKRQLATLIILASMLFTVFCPGISMGEEDRGLIMGMSWGPANNPPDPARGWDGWYCNEFGLTETLMALDFEQNLFPLLAESCTNVAPTQWEVRLKEGIAFQDGAPLNAEAVKLSFERFLNKDSKAFNERLERLLGLKSISVKDDRTIIFETEQPLASFAYKLADPGTGVVSPAGAEKGLFGTGPFKFKSFVPNEKLVVERYDGYWGKKAGLPRVTFVFNKDSQAKMLAFEAGDLDLLPQFPGNGRPAYAGRSPVPDHQEGKQPNLLFHTPAERRANGGSKHKTGL